MTSDQTHKQSPEPEVTPGIEPVSPPFLAYVGINQAARLTGKGKQQIYRDIEAGKLSWNVDASGKKTLQIADLARVYNLKPQVVTGDKTSHENRQVLDTNEAVTGKNLVETAVTIARLEERIAAKDEALREAKAQITDLLQYRDRLAEQNDRLTLLLTASPSPTPEPVTPKQEPVTAPKSEPAETPIITPPPVRLSWLQRLFK